jgi:hypothetical protein
MIFTKASSLTGLSCFGQKEMCPRMKRYEIRR